MTEIARIGVQVPAEPGPIDKIESILMELGGETRPLGGDHSQAPTVHRFTPGLASRTIYLPVGMVCTSAIHKTEHQYVVSAGHLKVYIEGTEWQHIRAPHIGITMPGTRRLLVILEDTIWTTFHPTDTTDITELERELTVRYDNPLLELSRYEEEPV